MQDTTTPNILDQARFQLLERNELMMSELEQALSGMMTHRIDFGELYFEQSHHESWMLEDSIIKDAQGDYGRLMAVLPEYLKNPNLFVSRRTEDMLRTVLSYNDVMKVAVPPDAKEVRLTIPKDEQAPIGREVGKDRMKIDTDSLEIPSNVSAR